MREVFSQLMDPSEPATTTVLLIELVLAGPLRPKELPEELLKPELGRFHVGLEVLKVVLGFCIVSRFKPVLRV